MANKKCPKCGTTLKETKERSSIAWTCPKCGYGEATTVSEPIYEDENFYSIVLLNNDSKNMSIVRVISKLTGLNFLQSIELINNPKEIFIGRPYDVLAKKEILDQNGINYIIEPNFPY